MDNMSKINLLRTKMADFQSEGENVRTENLEVSMFIRLDVLCHLAHDVKKYEGVSKSSCTNAITF